MLAPMEGVTHPTFRRMLAEKGGLGCVCTEFVRISGQVVNAGNLARHVDKIEGVPLSVQVMGNDADLMAEAAGMIAEAGADIVDINLGCPAPKIVRKGVGSAMLKDPELLERVLAAMRERVPGVLSAKIRAGFDDASGVVQIAKTVERAGADFIAVHPRRRADFYEGVADWRIVRVLKQELGIPVVGNGDVWYAADALRLMDETGCDAVMIGRPAVRNPWIFQQIDALRRGEQPYRPTGADVAAHLEEMVRRYRIAWAERRTGPIGRIKEALAYLGRAVRDDRQWRGEALRLQDLDEIVDVTWKRLGDLGPEAIDMDAHGADRLEKRATAMESATDAGGSAA